MCCWRDGQGKGFKWRERGAKAQNMVTKVASDGCGKVLENDGVPAF